MCTSVIRIQSISIENMNVNLRDRVNSAPCYFVREIPDFPAIEQTNPVGAVQ